MVMETPGGWRHHGGAGHPRAPRFWAGPLARLPEGELQQGLAQHDLVAWLEVLFSDGDAVDVGAVRGITVLNLESPAAVVDQRVTGLDGLVLEQVDVGLGRAAQHRGGAVKDELL